MKTIVFFNSVAAWGGGEKWHLEMASYLHDEQYRVIVYCQKGGELYQKTIAKKIETRPIDVGNLSFLNPYTILKLKALFQKDDPDLLILNISKDIKSGALAAKLAGVKKIVYRRGSAIPIKDNFLNRWYFKHVVTDMLTNSIATKKTVNEKNPNLFPEDKIKVIYNGLHLNEYYLNRKTDDTTFVIGNLGRLEFQKNQTALIDLAVLLKEKIQDFKILIGGDGRLMHDLKQKSKNLKVDDVIDFQGYITNVNCFMSQIDVFVLPSHWEGFGYVLAEASYHQKPIVAYNVSSNPEIVKNDITGFLLPKDALDLMAEKLLFLKNNPDLKEKIGIEGREFVMQNFDAKINQKAVEEYLLEII
ncbi:glycosyltransferase family 4 protein [Wenyingzhuangia sp. 1_MG-2023]|nr:glycosyltransferase family 4 protein [Wenyingzhuangia sp. 1_MG-2023]